MVYCRLFVEHFELNIWHVDDKPMSFFCLHIELFFKKLNHQIQREGPLSRAATYYWIGAFKHFFY